MIRNIINRIRYAMLPEFKGEPTGHRTMEEVINTLNGGDTMNITKIIETTQEEKIDITEITLISAEEFEEAKEIIPPCNEVWWWTRTPFAGYPSHVRVVHAGGGGALDGNCADYSDGVRPLAIFNPKSSNLKSPDRFKMSGETWTVIAEGKALCDRCVGRRPFRNEWGEKDANVYEKSDVKKWLDEWARKIWEE